MIENSSDFALFSAKPKMHKHSSGCFLASAQLMFICGVRARWWVVGGGGWSGDGTFDIILSTGPAAFQGSSCSGAGSRHQSHRADKGTGSGGRGLLPSPLGFPACASRPACVPFATFPRASHVETFSLPPPPSHVHSHPSPFSSFNSPLTALSQAPVRYLA